MFKKFFFLLLLLSLTGFIFLLSSYWGVSPKIFPPLKNFFSEIEKNTGKKISFTRVRTNFFTNLSLDNLTIYYGIQTTDGIFFKSRTVSFHYNIFTLLSHLKQPLKSIKELTFKKGEIFLTNRYSSRPVNLFSTGSLRDSLPKLFSEKQNLPPIFLIPKIHFKDFVLQTEDVSGKLPSLTVNNINGICLISNDKVIFDFWENEKWKINAEISLQNGGFYLKTKGENFPLTFSDWPRGNHLRGNHLNGYSIRPGQIQGKVNFLAEVHTNNWEEWDYQGTISLVQAKIDFANLPFKLDDTSVRLEFSKQKCIFSLKETKLGVPWLNLKGEIYPPYENPSLNGKVECTSLDWGKIKLSNLYFGISYSSQVLNITPIEFNLNEGKAKGNLHLDFRQGLNFLQAKSKIEIDRFVISKNLPELKGFTADINYRNDKLQIKGEDRKKIYQININAERKPEQIQIEKLSFVFTPPDKKYPSNELKFQGNLIFRQDRPSLKGKLFSDLNLIPIFLGYPGKELKGKISASIEGNFLKDSPILSGNLRINRGYWKKLSWEEITTSFTFTRENLSIDNFIIKQKKGKLLLQFNQFVNLSKFLIQAKAENFFLGNTSFYGVVESTGNYEGANWKSEFLLSNLRINKINLEKIEGEIHYADKKIALFSAISDFAQLESELNLFPGKEEIKGKLEIAATNWNKLEKIIIGGREKKSVSGELDGKLKGSFTLAGNLSQPKLQGEFQLAEGNWQGLRFSLQGNCLYDFSSPLILEISSSFQEPLSGEIKGKIEIGTPFSFLSGGYPNLKGTLESQKLFFSNNLSLENIKLKIRNEKERLLLTSFQAKFKESEIYLLNGSYIDKNKFVLFTELRNFHLPGLVLFGKVSFNGEIEINQKISLNTEVKTNNFWVNQHNFENTKFYLHYKNKNITFFSDGTEQQKFSGGIDFLDYPKIYLKNLSLTREGEKVFNFQGIVEKNNFIFSGEGKKFPLLDLVELTNLNIPCTGSVNFKLDAKGSDQNPIIYTEFNLNEGKIYEISFTTFTTIFHIENKTFFLENLRLVTSEKCSLTGSGKLPLTRKEKVKLYPFRFTFNLEEGDLSLLKNIFLQTKNIKGKINGNLDITGDIHSPQLEGKLTITNGEMETKNVLKKINELNVQLEFKGQNIILQSASAEIGQGKIEATGKMELDFPPKGEFPYFKIKDYIFSLKSSTDKGINVVLEDLVIPRSNLFKRLVYAPSQGEVKLNLNLVKGKDKPRLDGLLELINTHFTYPPKEKKTSGTWNRILNSLALNVEIRTKDNVWYENELADTNINGFLKLTTQGEKLKVNGKIEAVRGNLSYLNRNFEIKKAIFEVVDNVCYLEGTAETKSTVLEPDNKQIVPDVIVMFIERGKIGKIQPKFYSKNYPILTQEKVLSYVFSNVDTSALTREEQMILFRREILRWLDTSLTTPLIKNILGYTGLIDTVKMERETEEERNAKDKTTPADWREVINGSKITLEKYVLQNVLLGYSVKLDALVNRLDLKHEIELAYRFRWKGDVLLRATYELDKGRSASGGATPERKIYLEPRWRFGWEE